MLIALYGAVRAFKRWVLWLASVTAILLKSYVKPSRVFSNCFLVIVFRTAFEGYFLCCICTCIEICIVCHRYLRRYRLLVCYIKASSVCRSVTGIAYLHMEMVLYRNSKIVFRDWE